MKGRRDGQPGVRADHGHPVHPANPVQPGRQRRGGPGRPVRVVEEETGRLVGTMDEPSAHRFVHDGAVYLHQGESYLVGRLDLDDRVALVECRDPGYSTQARDVTDVDVIAEHRRARWGEADVVFGEVRVTRQVVGYTRVRSESKRRGAEVALELPERTLVTAAVWWTIPNDLVVPLAASHLGGAAHAAEHASIGMLPLFAIVAPAMLIPSLLGSRLYIGISEARFRQVVLGLLCLSGLALLASSVPVLLQRAG